MHEILWKREPYKGIGPSELFVLKEKRATVWSLAEDLSPVVESVLPEGGQLLKNERGLKKLLGVQWAPVLVHLNGDACGEAGRNLVPWPNFWTPVGWRSVVRRVAMFLVTIEEQSRDSLFREWKANSNGQ